MKQKWIAAFYPSDVFEDSRLKTLLCLLYDKVVIHFPITDMACGGGSGISGEFSDDPLVENGILDLREEILLDEIEYSSASDEEERKYYDLNVTGMALRCCTQEGAVPVTDKANTPIPISVLTQLDIKYAANIQASALAVQSLDLLLPDFASLNSYEILEAREKLKDQLTPFRAAMLSLAPKVRSGISGKAPLSQVFMEAKYIAETDVLPRLTELNRRIELERGMFWRKIIQKVGGNLPGIALKWISGAGLTAAIDVAKVGSGIAAQAIDNNTLYNNLLANGGLGYLLNIQKVIDRRVANQ